MSDLQRRMTQMSWSDPYDERPDPNWMVLMREGARKMKQYENCLRYWKDECSGNEPSLSVFNRMVDRCLE